jgi:hypothetical protein
MSEPEGFLTRWSRLKRETAERTDVASEQQTPHERGETAEANEAISESPRQGHIDARASAPVSKSGDTEFNIPSVDLSKLPPIESITAATDIRPFLAPGIPLELSRAALRRAWVADPNIRTFVGIAENQWDFTAPESIPGFGPLKAIDDVRRLVADVFGDISQTDDAKTASASECASESSVQPIEGQQESLPQATASEAPKASADECPKLSDAKQTLAGVHVATASRDIVQHSENDDATHKDTLDHESVTTLRPRRHGGALPE